jgi:hypothetical protein
MAKSFSDQVAERVAVYKKRLRAIHRGSAQDLAEGVTKPRAKGGNMRVKTGFLRASLMASTSMMPAIKDSNAPPSNAPDNAYDFDIGPISAVIAGLQPGDPLYLGFTAAYARPREYKDGFVRLAAQNWNKIVERNTQRAIKAFP